MLACACIAVDAQRTMLASIAKRHHLALAMFGAKLPLHPDSFRVLELYTERFSRHYEILNKVSLETFRSCERERYCERSVYGKRTRVW